MLEAPGYDTTQLLYESDGSIIYRARRREDDRPVVLKVLKAVRPPPEAIARFKREYLLTKELAQPGVIEALDHFQTENHWIIVTEDFGAESLQRLGLSGRISIEGFLSLAIEVTDTLARVHERGAVHNDVNPSNIVLNQDTNVAKLIDFGIASRDVPEASVPFTHPVRLEGTPAYLSPEQTGRVHQSLDYRSDYYALGCTFYELLTGRPPHVGVDLLDLIHRHLAHTPEPLERIRPDVPSQLSAIVLKLLAKNPDERYQSGIGIRADLDRCRQQAQGAETMVGPFILGAHDIVTSLRPPAKLYGRDLQTGRLLDVFSRVSRGGATQTALISGASGIGKTALVKALYASITEQRGGFASGKFDQFDRSTPYASIAAVFSSLIDQVLCEDAGEVARWRTRLSDALGSSRAVLHELVPHLSLITGPVPPPTPVASAEAKTRMITAMIEFLRAFARPSRPLVLFLDDLQWADLASIDFIQTLATESAIRHLLIIGAYRDDEVRVGHPLAALIRELDDPLHFTLRPLGASHVADYLADVLRLSPGEVSGLACSICDKTGGNPLYIRQFLEALHAQGLLRFDESRGTWVWVEEEILSSDICVNVADLLVGKLSRLPAETRALLTWAACMGNRFSLGDLTITSQRPAREVMRSLLPAIARGFVLTRDKDYSLFETDTAGLIERIGATYKFAHDRILQAVYDGVGDARREQMHLQIGRRLKEHRPDLLLEPVRHLNAANHLITDSGERAAVARLSLRAGTKASQSAAYAAAFDLFSIGLSFLRPPGRGAARDGKITGPGSDAYAEDYELCLRLTEAAAEAASLTSNFDAMDTLLENVLHHANGWGDKAGAHLVKIRTLTARGRQLESIAVAREVLRPLGVELPDEGDQSAIDASKKRVQLALADRPIESLSSLPRSRSNKGHQVALEILREIYVTTLMCQQALAPAVAANMVLLTLQHGRAEGSAIGLTFHGIHLCETGSAQSIEEGYHFTQIARAICAKDGLDAELVDVDGHGFYHVLHLKEPIRDLMGVITRCHRTAWETGNTNMVAGCLASRVAGAFIAGFELPDLAAEMSEVIGICQSRGYATQQEWVEAYLQCALNFMEGSADPCRLRGRAYDEEARLPEERRAEDVLMVQLVHMLRIILGYRFGRYREVVDSYTTYVEDRFPKSGLLLPPVLMYYCLARLAVLRESHCPEERQRITAEVGDKLEQLKVWSIVAPANYAHKYHLVAAELARTTGAGGAAREHYDEAIDLARKNQYLNEESLALECAARYFRERHKNRLASYYLQDALYAYTRWGARAMVSKLEAEFPDLLVPDGAARRRSTLALAARPPEGTQDGFGEERLTLEALLRASKTMTTERDQPALLRKVMETCLAYAGATRGFLILVRQDELVVKAEGLSRGMVEVRLLSEDMREADYLCHSIVHFVVRTAEPVCLEDAASKGAFTEDPHVRDNRCRSVLCIPILYQGRLVGVAYLENNLATGAFSKDIVDILALLMTQAAVSLENARLKSLDEHDDFWFTVGGSLAGETPSYVQRDADHELARAIERGDYCYVFDARQMGKSSLRVRTMQRLAARGFQCVSVDMSSIGSANLSAEQWYASIAQALASGLGRLSLPDLRRWWTERALLSPALRLSTLIDEILDGSERIVVFIDEIDATLSLGFSSDEFFALIRSFFNKRADDARYGNLAFVLLGVATPAQLIRDEANTPFNIGRSVVLRGFRPDEARVLSAGLRGFEEPDRVLREILAWTEGQPFLTQKICQLALEAESRPAADRARGWVANLVRDKIIANWRTEDEPTHLRTIEARVLRSKRRGELVRLYGEVSRAGGISSRGSDLEMELVLSGLVVREWGRVRVGNPIYAAVFDEGWIGDLSRMLG